jgi:SAM-dependent methyltransferase
MHENSVLLFRKHALRYFAPGMRVLEVGPDGSPSTYQKLVSAPNPSAVWETLDINSSPFLTYPNSEPYKFPVPENRYDIVFSGQVIEHVPKIWRWMAELSRVAKVGGRVIIINPVSWPFHEFPFDCWRIYPEGMKALCEDSGLVVETSVWESLETPNLQPFWATDKTPVLRYAIAGKSMQQQHIIRQIQSRLLGRFGGRVERSFDTVTVAQKLESKTSHNPKTPLT